MGKKGSSASVRFRLAALVSTSTPWALGATECRLPALPEKTTNLSKYSPKLLAAVSVIMPPMDQPTKCAGCSRSSDCSGLRAGERVCLKERGMGVEWRD